MSDSTIAVPPAKAAKIQPEAQGTADQAGKPENAKPTAPRTIIVLGEPIGLDENGRIYSQYDAEQAIRIWGTMNPSAIGREAKLQGLNLKLEGIPELQAAMLASTGFTVAVGSNKVTPRDMIVRATRQEILKATRIAVAK